MKAIRIAALSVAASVVVVGLIAARSSGGTYSLPSSPFVSGTTISSSVMNGNFSDIGNEITDSLDRSGKGGMLAPLKLTDGTAGAPSLTFTNEPASGLWRNTTNDLRMSVNGVYRQRWTTTGVIVNGSMTALGSVLVTDTVSGNACTISAPSSLAAAYALTLPTALPGSTLPVSLSSGGALSAAQITGSQIASSIALSGTPSINGNLALTGSNPSSSTGFTNTLTPANIPKAWGRVTLGAAGAATVDDGFNVASASWSTSLLTVVFATNQINSSAYAVSAVLLGNSVSSTFFLLAPVNLAQGGFSLQVFNTSATAQNWTSGLVVQFMVMGKQ